MRPIAGLTLLLLALAGAPAVRADQPQVVVASGPDHGTDAMRAELGLSDDQVRRLQSVDLASRAQAKPHLEELKVLLARLKKQYQAKAPDDDLRATLESVKQERLALEAIDRGLRDQRTAILTPRQQAHLLVVRAQPKKPAKAP